jgi:hypothetical protein
MLATSCTLAVPVEHEHGQDQVVGRQPVFTHQGPREGVAAQAPGPALGEGRRVAERPREVRELGAHGGELPQRVEPQVRQELAQELLHLVEVLGGALGLGAAALGVVGGRHQLEGEPGAGERRPQLVGHALQRLLLLAQQRVDPVGHRVERGAHLFELGRAHDPRAGAEVAGAERAGHLRQAAQAALHGAQRHERARPDAEGGEHRERRPAPDGPGRQQRQRTQGQPARVVDRAVHADLAAGDRHAERPRAHRRRVGDGGRRHDPGLRRPLGQQRRPVFGRRGPQLGAHRGGGPLEEVHEVLLRDPRDQQRGGHGPHEHAHRVAHAQGGHEPREQRPHRSTASW